MTVRANRNGAGLTPNSSFVGLTAGKYQVPDEGQAGAHSPFTAALLKHLRERTDSLQDNHEFTFEKLASLVEEEVTAELCGKVIPQWGLVDGGQGGKFVFVPSQPDVKTPSEQRHRDTIKRLLDEADDLRNREQPILALRALWEARDLDESRRPELLSLRRQQVESARGLCSRPRFVWTHPPFPDPPPLVFTPKEIYDAVFHPDGRTVATAGSDGMVRFWNVGTGKPHSDPLKHAAPVRCIGYSSDGNRLAAGLPDGRVLVWNLRSRTSHEFAAAGGNSLSVGWVDFSPDGKRVLALDVGHVRILDVLSGKLVFQIPYVFPVAAARFSSDGTKVLVAATTGTARVWEVNSGKPVGPPMRHGGRVNAVAFRPDGQVVATAGEGGDLKFWNPLTGIEWESTIQIGKPILWVDYAPSEFGTNGPFLAIQDSDGEMRRYVRNREHVYLWDRRPLNAWPMARHRRSSPDQRLTLELTRGAIWLWDNATRGPGGPDLPDSCHGPGSHVHPRWQPTPSVPVAPPSDEPIGRPRSRGVSAPAMEPPLGRRHLL